MKKLLFFLFFTSAVLADVTIFAYHRFGDAKYPSTSISIEKLRKDFQYLKDNGYRVAPLKEIVDTLKQNQPLPKKTVVLTIDDGYRSFYQNGLEVFKEFNYPFTVFICSDATNKRYGDYMRWNEIKETLKYGEAALHTHTHPHMTYMSDKAIKEEVKDGIKLFKEKLGFTSPYFAYPYGEFDDRVKRLVKEFGFKAIFNQNAGAVASFSDVYDIDRIAIGEDTRINTALKTKSLDMIWNKEVLRNNTFGIISGKVKDPKVRQVEIFVSGYGWQWVKVKNGEFSYPFNKPIKKQRSRIIAKTSDRKYSTLLVMKEKN